MKDLILGYKYDDYIKLREKMLINEVNTNETIYIIAVDGLFLELKKNVSMLEIEKFKYVGKMLGIDVYIEHIILKLNPQYLHNVNKF